MKLASLLVVLVCTGVASAQKVDPGKGINPGGPGGGSGQPTKPGDAPGGLPTSGSGGNSGPSAGSRGTGLGPQPTIGSSPVSNSMMATGGADLEALTGGELVEDWWLWWEINKSDYLIPKKAPRAPRPPKDETRTETEEERRERIAQRLLPTFAGCLKDDSAAVRASAATTLGRLGGADVIDALLPLLADPVQSVREATLLALGATGSARAASTLLRVAQNGRAPGASEEIGPTARPMALVALALGRRHGLEPSIDPLVEALLYDPAIASDVLEAGLLYRTMSGAEICDDLLRDLATRKDLDIRLRCRVTESLSLDDDTLLANVLEELGDGNTDRRRSAAVTLARSPSAFAFPKLQKAFEKEEEPMTRGLMLVSIGQRGGDEARDFLLKLLRRGRAVDRPWVALSLGLLARASGDETAREALREGMSQESSAQSLGAWLLACGLAQDLQAGPALRDFATTASDPKLRMFASVGLSMLRDEESLAVLRERLVDETSPLARGAVELSVALQNRKEDAARLLQDVRDANNPALQAQLASAVGLHDTGAAVDGLEALLTGPDELSDVAQASTIDALGLLLDPNQGFQLVRASTQRNFAVFPDWLARALVLTNL